MPKSRRVMRKSRKTRGRRGTRRYRGGFFGKLFEGFQMSSSIQPITISDNAVGGSGSSGSISAVSTVPMMQQAKMIDLDAEPTRGAQIQAVSTVQSSIPRMSYIDAIGSDSAPSVSTQALPPPPVVYAPPPPPTVMSALPPPPTVMSAPPPAPAPRIQTTRSVQPIGKPFGSRVMRGGKSRKHTRR